MRHFRTIAAFTLIVLAPMIAGAASWQPATARTVLAGVSSNSTFVIAGYLTLPNQCYVARVRTLTLTSQLHRSFIIEQMPGPSTCTAKTEYHCTVMSPSFRLPIPHQFDVETKGKTWQVTMGAHAPEAIQPMCAKG
jgi:hypothetical protein